jgi:AcrR family transcriptional regulator
LYSAHKLYELIRFKRKTDLLKDAYAINRTSTEVCEALLKSLLDDFAYASHEWPAAILWSPERATPDQYTEIMSEVALALRQRKTGRPMRFELTEQTRESLDAYLRSSGRAEQVLFPGRGGPDRYLTTRQYARLVERWVASVCLDPRKFATHSMRRTKETLIYRRMGNLRVVQLLLSATRGSIMPRVRLCPVVVS